MVTRKTAYSLAVVEPGLSTSSTANDIGDWQASTRGREFTGQALLRCLTRLASVLGLPIQPIRLLTN